MLASTIQFSNNNPLIPHTGGPGTEPLHRTPDPTTGRTAGTNQKQPPPTNDPDPSPPHKEEEKSGTTAEGPVASGPNSAPRTASTHQDPPLVPPPPPGDHEGPQKQQVLDEQTPAGTPTTTRARNPGKTMEADTATCSLTFHP